MIKNVVFKDRKESLKINISAGILITIIGLCISFISVPITLNYLGNESYGLWVTIFSVINWINYFDIGIGNGLRNRISESLAENNKKDVKQLISTAYGMLAIISIVTIIIILIVVPFINLQSIFNTKTFSSGFLYEFLLINIIFVSVNFILRIINQIFNAFQRNIYSNINQLVNQIFAVLGIMFAAMFTKGNLIILSLITGGAAIFSSIIFSSIFFIKNKEYTPNIKYFQKSKVGTITNIGMRFFIIQITVLIITTTDNLVITKLFGPSEVTQYSLVQKVFNCFVMFHGIIMTPIVPTITEAYIKKDIIWIKNVINKLFKLYAIIIFGIICCVIGFKWFASIWLGNSIDFKMTLIVQMGIYAIISIWCSSVAYIINGTGKINIQLYMAIIQALINIPLSIYLAKNIGLGNVGVIMATNITLAIGVIILPINLYCILKNET